MYYENSVKFCGKSLRSAKSRHPKVSKIVRQVYISQKMPSVDMILYFETFCESTIFVKKKKFQSLKKCCLVFYVKSSYNCKNGV